MDVYFFMLEIKSLTIDEYIQFHYLIYCHDLHKTKGISHNDYHKMYPELNKLKGFDGMCSDMSRPGEKKKKYDKNGRETTDVDNYRISLIDGVVKFIDKPDKDNVCNDLRINFRHPTESIEKVHEKLLLNKSYSLYNEDPYYPFTSLKYHIILLSNICHNYRKGYEFNELCLKSINKNNIIDIFDVVFIHPSIDNCLVIVDKDIYPECPSSKIGCKPAMMFGNTLRRGNINIHRDFRSELYRINSWSTGLQYYEDLLDSEKNYGSI